MTMHITGANDLNFADFDSNDVSSVALQRTSALFRAKLIGCPSYSLWHRGMPQLLRLEARLRRNAILYQASTEIAAEYRIIRSALKDFNLDHVMDIGCGHAIMQALFHRDNVCRITLIDIESNDRVHHDFHDQGAGYASLDKARAFLVSNAVPSNSITTFNPQVSQLPQARDVNLVMSLLSCGFHYPLATYLDYAKKVLVPNGRFLFDLRKGSGQDEILDQFANWSVLAETRTYRRVLAQFEV